MEKPVRKTKYPERINPLFPIIRFKKPYSILAPTYFDEPIISSILRHTS
jgi:hypothetical protein